MTKDLAPILIVFGLAWTLLIVGKAVVFELKDDEVFRGLDGCWWAPFAKTLAVAIVASPGMAMVVMGAML